MLGAIAGDIIGSVYEFNNIRHKNFEPLFAEGCRYTDDTICTVAIADTLMNNKPATETLRQWCSKYWKKGRWGQKFALWLALPNSEPYNSYGNGSAMRVSPCAWLASSHEQALEMATLVTVTTHSHPEGIKGAHSVTSAIYFAINGSSHQEIRNIITQTYGYDLTRSVDEIRINNPHSEACQESVPEAITCALESTSFEDAIRNAISIGGDSDTIAAITGSIAEAMYEIPEDIIQSVKSKMPEEMLNVTEQFYKLIHQRYSDTLER